jgi:hypothetical protein
MRTAASAVREPIHMEVSSDANPKAHFTLDGRHPSDHDGVVWHHTPETP